MCARSPACCWRAPPSAPDEQACLTPREGRVRRRLPDRDGQPLPGLAASCRQGAIMNKEDSLAFVHERLRHNHAPPARESGLRNLPRVTRRFVVELEQGEAHVFEHVDRTVILRCNQGGAWVTHDRDSKDLILMAGEEYRAEREDPLHVYALVACVLEIEFEDDVTQH
jgi:hypothetical protein